MTAPRSLTDPERGKLLKDLTTLKSDDDDAVVQDPKWFLPLDAHVRALRLETLVVRGGRGAGKSSLFHFLGHMQKQPALGQPLGATSQVVTTWLEGFGAGVEHPNVTLVGTFGSTADDDRRRSFWFGWLCARLSSETNVAFPSDALADAVQSMAPAALADAATRDLGALSAWMDSL